MTGKEYLFFGNDSGETFRFDSSVYTDNGSAVPMRIKTKYYSFDDIGTRRLYRYIQIFGDFPNGALASYSIQDERGRQDYEAAGQITNENQRIDIYEKGNALSLGFDIYSAHRAELNGFKIFYKDTKEIL